MRSVRIVTCEANLHGRHLLSERVEDFQTLTLRQQGDSMAQVHPVLRSMIEDTTVRNSPAVDAAPIRMLRVRLDARTCSLSV